MKISVRDHMVLTLAGTRFGAQMSRVKAARELVGYSETRFWLRVDQLIDRPEVEAAYPMLASRQKRLRESRRRARTRGGLNARSRPPQPKLRRAARRARVWGDYSGPGGS